MVESKQSELRLKGELATRIELALPTCKPFHGEYVASRDGGITLALLMESYNRISIYCHFPS